MSACLGQSQAAQGADATVRAVAAPTPVVLAVIHVVDLPGTLAWPRWPTSGIWALSPPRPWSAGL